MNNLYPRKLKTVLKQLIGSTANSFYLLKFEEKNAIFFQINWKQKNILSLQTFNISYFLYFQSYHNHSELKQPLNITCNYPSFGSI